MPNPDEATSRDPNAHPEERIDRLSDGLDWKIASGEPILAPGSGWKKSHVYALDVKRVGERFHLYFNARSGWLSGVERLGLAFEARPGASSIHGPAASREG